MSKTFYDYDCLHRFVGDCKTCYKDRFNLVCANYYPVRIMAGEAVVNNRETAMRIKKELLEKSL